MKSAIGSLIVSAVLLAPLASGQTSKVSEERRKEILDYQITMSRANQLIAALGELLELPPPDVEARERPGERMGSAERIEKDPRAMDILKKHQLTAKDYTLGMIALQMSMMIAGGTPESPFVFASPGNIAFVKANLSDLRSKIDGAEARTRR